MTHITSPLVHYTEVKPGDRVRYGDYVFVVTAPAVVSQGGSGCKAACFLDGHGCLGLKDGRTDHDVVWFPSEAVEVPGDQGVLFPFVKALGDPWTFQVRGDLAWFDADRVVAA